jgi:hypothetical protein
MVNIYTLSDPRYPNDIRYVGQTIKKLNTRLSIHIAPKSLISKTHKNNWIKSLLEVNIIPLINLIEEVNDDEWSIREIYWINYYKSIGYKLTNSTDGGEGMLNPNEETRKKLSNANSGENNPNFGKKRSLETNDKINEIRVIKHTEETKLIIGENSKGRKHTEETKQKISEAHLGKIVSEYTRKKISDAQLGKIVTDDTKEKLSIACTGEKNGFFGKEHTEETKKKMAENKLGKKHSEETILKMSDAQSGEKNGFFGKKHSEETKKKMAETRRRKKELKEKNESIG